MGLKSSVGQQPFRQNPPQVHQQEWREKARPQKQKRQRGLLYPIALQKCLFSDALTHRDMSKKPIVCIVVGMAGSGKTTVMQV